MEGCSTINKGNKNQYCFSWPPRARGRDDNMHKTSSPDLSQPAGVTYRYSCRGRAKNKRRRAPPICRYRTGTSSRACRIIHDGNTRTAEVPGTWYGYRRYWVPLWWHMRESVVGPRQPNANARQTTLYYRTRSYVLVVGTTTNRYYRYY